MKILPYICFNGNCAEAVSFYEKVFQAKNLGISRFGDTEVPDYQMPEEAKNLIMHTAIEFDGNMIMLADSFPGQAVTQGNGVMVAVVSTDIKRVTSIYNGLAEGGEMIMELQETFWSPAFGMVHDKFGITWQISAQAELA